MVHRQTDKTAIHMKLNLKLKKKITKSPQEPDVGSVNQNKEAPSWVWVRAMINRNNKTASFGQPTRDSSSHGVAGLHSDQLGDTPVSVCYGSKTPCHAFLAVFVLGSQYKIIPLVVCLFQLYTDTRRALEMTGAGGQPHLPFKIWETFIVCN